MKTTKRISSLISALLLFAVTSAFSAIIDNRDGRISANPLICHHVNIIAPNDKSICNVYLVEILNGNGQLVAPAKRYIPGVSKYDFYERGPASGARVAVLVLAPMQSHFMCETELFTAPVVLQGPFLPGQTYRYDLFPQPTPHKN
jgi:hypothetical protein